MPSDLTARLGGARSSLAFKAPCRVATTANITLSGFQTIDGITPASGDTNLRILVKDQTDTATNGIYEMSSGTWSRARDFDGSDDVVKGARIYVANGTTNAGRVYVVSTSDPITVGTTGIAFARSGDVAGPSTTTDYENAVFSGTTGVLLRTGGVISLTPRMFGATGSGTETSAIQSLFTAHAATSGSEIVIDRPYTIGGPITHTTDNLRLRFERDGELIMTGSTTMYGALQVGTAGTALTGRSLTSNADRHSTSLTFNDASGMSVGHILRITYTGPHTVQQSFCAKILAKSSNTVYLSHPLPWALTTSTTFVSLTSGVSLTGAIIENLNARASSYTGAALTALRMDNCDNIRVYGSKTSGMISGGMVIVGCVDPAIYDHLGVDDGSASSDAAFPVYAMSGGVLSNITIRSTDHFGFNLDYIHHARLEKISGNDIGNTGGYVRALKLWDCSSNVIRDIDLWDIVGQGTSCQNGTRDNLLINWRVSAMEEGVVLGSPYPAQGITTNGTGNTNNIWVGVSCLGTPTADGGTDIAIGSSDSGQIFIGANYDTISNNEASTTTIIRRNGVVTGLLASSPTFGVGYTTGAGGAVTQATSRTTGVTLNTAAGAVTLVSAAGSTTPASFTVTNSAVAATDTIILSQKSGSDKYVLLVTAVAAGSFQITAYTTGGTTTEQPVISFSVIKSVAA